MRLFLALLPFMFCTYQYALAVPLSKEKCAELQQLKIELNKHPSVKNMSKGHEWVKENLHGDDLQPIKQFLETEENLLFRCKNKGKIAALKKKNKKKVKAAPKTPKKQVTLKFPPLPERKLLMAVIEPKPRPIKIIRPKKAAKTKKSTAKPEEGTSLIDFFFPEEEEPTNKKAKKSAKKSQ